MYQVNRTLQYFMKKNTATLIHPEAIQEKATNVFTTETYFFQKHFIPRTDPTISVGN